MPPKPMKFILCCGFMTQRLHFTPYTILVTQFIPSASAWCSPFDLVDTSHLCTSHLSHCQLCDFQLSYAHYLLLGTALLDCILKLFRSVLPTDTYT
ncbi:hypothetical protein GDO81_013837 [Engystomops pustulosus]|uniref:Uncharacterized protein n=1 Tax=Engystomops pustulosus TaxID=76066 RepID=A0AAV7B602_ENGPU|nr:hypothetical protein GDO81_013837 [Engystomops pustulosus]